MTFAVAFTAEAESDLIRLYDFLLDASDGDFELAERALLAIREGVRFLERSPFSCRKALPNDPLLRELLIPFGAAGYVALFRIADDANVVIVAERHQREDDYR